MSSRDIALHRFAGPFTEPVWTSPLTSAGFAATQLIASWTASTPGESHVCVEISGITETGERTKWFNLGEWAADDTHFKRRSIRDQADPQGDVAADIFKAHPGHALTQWQVRVTCTGQARLHAIHLMASGDLGPAGRSAPRWAKGKLLEVPAFSQRVHRGVYPQWDGGGESWCSATSTAMVLAYWKTGPSRSDYAWVDPSYPDPQVIHAARHTFDSSFGGCGNWPFNTAYAGQFGVNAFVTRLRSLNEAEQFIEAGIPLIASAAYAKGQVTGLDYDTKGHLMVLAGFTPGGDPILNDPYSLSAEEVTKPVNRAEWEDAWLGTSGGLVYVIHPESASLPPAPAQANW
jgi:hypothetical protein